MAIRIPGSRALRRLVVELVSLIPGGVGFSLAAVGGRAATCGEGIDIPTSYDG